MLPRPQFYTMLPIQRILLGATCRQDSGLGGQFGSEQKLLLRMSAIGHTQRVSKQLCICHCTERRRITVQHIVDFRAVQCSAYVFLNEEWRGNAPSG
jgi:hypothetical protein